MMHADQIIWLGELSNQVLVGGVTADSSENLLCQRKHVRLVPASCPEHIGEFRFGHVLPKHLVERGFFLRSLGR